MTDSTIATSALGFRAVLVIARPTRSAIWHATDIKIFDADTHVRPDADLLEPYLTAAARAKLAQYEKYKAKNKDGAVTYLMGERTVQAPTGSSRLKQRRKKTNT